MKKTTRFAYSITYKCPRTRRTFEGVQFHPNRTSALGANIENHIVTDARKLTEAEAAKQNVPFSVEVS